MGILKRKYNKDCQLFYNTLRKPLKMISYLMPVGFTNEMFYEIFKQCYPYLWDDIRERSYKYRKDDLRRRAKGKKTFNFLEPNTYLDIISKVYISNVRARHKRNGTILCAEERENQIERLKNEAAKRIEKREKNKSEKLRYKQKVTPEYVNYFITEYFRLRRKNPLDVNPRYLIILEAAKFKCDKTVEFLQKINACEKNDALRYAAFKALHELGEQVYLRRKRKGKKKLSMTIEPTIQNTPKDLLDAIYNYQIESNKVFDVFLSHSSYDEDELIKLKAQLNSENFTVYVDWVNDRSMLSRDLTDVNTAKVIIDRLQKCKSMILVLTENCLTSKWTPWEVGYFHALGKPVCIYYPQEISEELLPPYWNLYPRISITASSMCVLEEGINIDLKKWISKEDKMR